MKIAGQNSAIAKELSTGQTKSKEVSRDGQSSNVENLKGNGSITTSNFTLNKIKNIIAAEPDVRADRVAELKAQIQSGEYQVDFSGLADKMINDSMTEDR